MLSILSTVMELLNIREQLVAEKKNGKNPPSLTGRQTVETLVKKDRFFSDFLKNSAIDIPVLISNASIPVDHERKLRPVLLNLIQLEVARFLHLSMNFRQIVEADDDFKSHVLNYAESFKAKDLPFKIKELLTNVENTHLNTIKALESFQKNFEKNIVIYREIDSKLAIKKLIHDFISSFKDNEIEKNWRVLYNAAKLTSTHPFFNFESQNTHFYNLEEDIDKFKNCLFWVYLGISFFIDNYVESTDDEELEEIYFDSAGLDTFFDEDKDKFLILYERLEIYSKRLMTINQDEDEKEDDENIFGKPFTQEEENEIQLVITKKQDGEVIVTHQIPDQILEENYKEINLILEEIRNQPIVVESYNEDLEFEKKILADSLSITMEKYNYVRSESVTEEKGGPKAVYPFVAKLPFKKAIKDGGFVEATVTLVILSHPHILETEEMKLIFARYAKRKNFILNFIKYRSGEINTLQMLGIDFDEIAADEKLRAKYQTHPWFQQLEKQRVLNKASKIPVFSSLLKPFSKNPQLPLHTIICTYSELSYGLGIPISKLKTSPKLITKIAEELLLLSIIVVDTRGQLEVEGYDFIIYYPGFKDSQIYTFEEMKNITKAGTKVTELDKVQKLFDTMKRYM